ncbi:MAG: hypothetical protein HOE80_04160 [Candidatus Magasanikbacteria bacterium]|jgi:alpha-2-macroglobulin|nr:hypothetical protein [Candidatus Magasanikbacteria bacterium]MBT4071888.1 hypothetical protein [Candidatus Magasanikbacteria bacterium]
MKNKFFTGSSVKISTCIICLFLIPLSIYGYTQVNAAVKNDDKNLNRPGIRVEAEKNSRDVVSLSTLDEPAIYISGSDKDLKEVHINVYKADSEHLLDYLIYDAGNYKKEVDQINVQDFPFIGSVDVEFDKNDKSYYRSKKVLLPVEMEGIYLLNIIGEDTNIFSYVVRSNFGVVAHESQDEIIFWAQDLSTKYSKEEGVITVYNLEDEKTVLDKIPLNQKGIAKTKKIRKADIALIQSDNHESIVFLNYREKIGRYVRSPFIEAKPRTRFFAFTDRPIYKPGDAVYYKAILRTDMDADYTVVAGAVDIEVSTGWGNDRTVVYTDKKTMNQYGAIDGEFVLPKYGDTGGYTINIKKSNAESVVSNWSGRSYIPSANVSFRVEQYRKPEYTLDVGVKQDNIVAGDDVLFTVNGRYFSGQPLNNKTVSYKISKRSFNEPQMFAWMKPYQSFYGYYYGGSKSIVKEGTAILDKDGDAEIILEDVEKENMSIDNDYIYNIEVTYRDNTQNNVSAASSIRVFRSDYGIFKKNNYYSIRAGNDVNLEFEIIPYQYGVSVEDKNVTIEIYRTEWVCSDRKYWNCKKTEETLPAQEERTNIDGDFFVNLNDVKKGSYKIIARVQDMHGRSTKKVFNFWVGNYRSYSNTEDKGIVIEIDKEAYVLGDNINIELSSTVDNQDVLVSVERDWVKKFEIVSIKDGKGIVSFPIDVYDIPNINIGVSSFSDLYFRKKVKGVKVSAEIFQLDVDVQTDKETYGPGDTVMLDITTRDSTGKGVPSESTIWLVDKALYELVGDKTGDIFNKFWSKQYAYTSMTHSLEKYSDADGFGGCFSGDTKILMEDGSEKKIEEIQSGDTVLTFLDEKENLLVRGKVTSVHNVKVAGYLILNENLKITPNHILYVNDEWKEAGLIQIGDILRNRDGNEEKVYSIEWQKGEFDVYNLEIDTYHTFIAEGIWVHNDKGGGGVRSNFEDAAYWNPSVRTNAQGKARVTFILPDNLTTWVISAVSVTKDTRVGQVKDEIIATKDVFVQPVLPNILRVGDELVVSGIVNNYSDVDRTFDISLEFDSGEVVSSTQKVFIPSGDFKQIDWFIFPEVEKEDAVFTFFALDEKNDNVGDIIETKIPVKTFGFWEKRAFTAHGNHTYEISPFATSTKHIDIDLNMSLNAMGPIVSAMEYLVKYPYGCMEQTTSRFVPNVIAKEYQYMFKEALKDKKLDDMIYKGIERLTLFQNKDGGWAWWNSSQSELPLSTYIFEYIIRAKQVGIDVDDALFEKGVKFFEQMNSSTTPYVYKENTKQEVLAYRNYMLAMLGKKTNEITVYDGLDVEALSYAIIANQKAGFMDAANEGIEILLQKANGDDKYLYWDAAAVRKYGSKSASNALALRALLAVNYSRATVDKVVANLLDNRKGSYWANTYGTARVIQPLVEYLDRYQLQNNNRYSLYLDNKKIEEGVIDQYHPYVAVSISQKDILSEGSSLRLVQEGTSRIYSTLVIEDFNLDTNAEAIRSALSVERSYKNEKGENHSIGIGDVVEVSLKVTGLDSSKRYLIIEDFLPAGMIPINTNLKNEKPGNYYDHWYWYGNKDYTLDGVQIYLKYLGNNAEKIITYKARVVNEGVFHVPPANVAYMYEPESFAMTSADVMTIEKESKKLYELKDKTFYDGMMSMFVGKQEPVESDNKYTLKYLLFLIPVIIILSLVGFFVRKRDSSNMKKKKNK